MASLLVSMFHELVKAGFNGYAQGLFVYRIFSNPPHNERTRQCTHLAGKEAQRVMAAHLGDAIYTCYPLI